MTSTPDRREGASRDAELLKNPFRGVAPEVAADLAVALASGSGLVPALTAAAGPVVSRGIAAMSIEWNKARWDRAASVVAEATEATGSSEAFLSAARAADGGMELTIDTMVAASRTRLPASVRAMGRALAHGLLHDGTRLDMTRVTIEALSELQPFEAAVLDTIVRGGDISTNDLRAKVPSLEAGLHRALAVLNAQGFLVETTMVWRASEFGNDAIAWLLQAGYEAGGTTTPGSPSLGISPLAGRDARTCCPMPGCTRGGP